MKLIENEIWLEIEEITEGCNISDRTIRIGLERGSSLWQTIKDPADRRRTLVRYSTLSKKYKDAIKANLTNGLEPLQFHETQQNRSLSEAEGQNIILADRLTKAYEKDFLQFLNLYHPDTEDAVKRQRQKRDLARAAAFIVALTKHYEETATPFSKYIYYNEASEWLTDRNNIRAYGRANNKGSEMSITYLPTAPTRLAEKVKEYANNTPIAEVIKQPRSGNENRLGEFHTFAKGAMARLLTEGKNTSDSMMIRKVQFACLKKGLSAPSEATGRRLIADLQSLTALKRYGDANKASHKFRNNTPLLKAMNAGDCWEMDGTRVQLQPHLIDGNLKYLYVVAVRDNYSGLVVGWSFGLAESELMYREALRMAVTLTGYLPHELIHDKFPGHESNQAVELLSKLEQRGVKLTKTSMASGKASAERWYGTLQSVFEMDRKEWVGQGIQSSRHYNRPSKEYLSKVKNQLDKSKFSWEDAWKIENDVITLYNHTPLSFYSQKYKTIDQSPVELHNNDTDKKNIKSVELWDIPELFWATRNEKIRNYQIKFKVNGLEYILDLVGAEYYHITRKHKEVNIRFDASDMSEVMLFDCITNRHLATIIPFQPIQLHGENPEYGRLAERNTKVKEQKAMAKAELQTITDGCDEDVLSISLASILPKEIVEQAETSAMATYYKNVIPIKPNVQPKTKAKSKPEQQPRRTENIQVEAKFLSEGDYMNMLLNQL